METTLKTFKEAVFVQSSCKILNHLFLQIFPDPVEIVLGPEASLNSPNRDKERLPSIVVEPTEVSEVESGELRWPPENIEAEDDEEDLFLEQSETNMATGTFWASVVITYLDIF
uniref:LBH domain-containing protein n=1 Tax=Fundulus heteroclitus TaxID=8078 RepID=A0A3Q2QRD0_FUNHE